MKQHIFPLCLSLTILAGLQPTCARAVDDALDLSLEELMQVVVTSVSKRAQTLAETAAAVYVIQAEDIRRSGASNIPEALRLAPGVQVAAIGNNKWAVSIRGQADRFTNKLLVLVDGRSVYSPLFSGVVWEVLDIPLENIARIEVIRGPGASLWGANAVNGVINIITQSAFDTLGGKAAVAVGNELRGYGFARYSWLANADTAVQLHAKAHASDASRFASGGDGVDDWHNRSAGFRVDQRRGADNLHVQGGLFTSQAGDELLFITPAGIAPVRHDQVETGGHLLGRWQNSASDAQQDSIQFYIEHSDYDHIILGEKRTTLDLEFQRQLRPSTSHELTFGLGYRYSRDDITTSSLITLPKTEAATSLYSAFIQDEILLQPEHWRLTLGARLEHNEYTGFEFQPNLRLLWTPTRQNSAWISAARAIRTPARIERSGIVFLPISTTSVLALDNSLTREEQLDAFDLGWRIQINPAASLDLTAFNYHYDQLRNAAIIGAPVLQPGGYVFIPTINSNANSGSAHGIEASLDWRPHNDWRVQAAYSLLDYKIELAPGSLSSNYADTSPRHIFSLRVAQELNSHLHWDAWLRHTGKIEAYAIPAYTTLDLRLAWQPYKDLELSLVGQNLLESAHLEYDSGFVLSTHSQIERGLYLKADWKF